MAMKYATYLLVIVLLNNSCDRIDEATKKKIQKESKKVAKQIVGTAEHFDGQHRFISFEANKNNTKIKMYWKDANNKIIGNLQALNTHVKSQGDSLLYACNGGMYMQNQSPLGWFVENGKQIKSINTKNGKGNFYLHPKGVFGIWQNTQGIIHSVQTKEEIDGVILEKYTYGTQSGPMLIYNGKINELFTKNSSNLNIRNGVGILPNGNTYFAMSTYPISFYDFAKHFKEKGCKDALYLDGFVSRSYCPSLQYEQLDGEFGVMIGVVAANK
jgi:uncharacterized protein YigE (DUF2233 family)